ncbi:MAG TPA: NfeD family protein [Candidatus Sumerlaeota bacterium]|nr:NfeD family protein [Candidatus Sumerlaeota bacterium]
MTRRKENTVLWLLILGFLFASTGSVWAAQAEVETTATTPQKRPLRTLTQGDRYRVYRIEMRDDIDNSLAFSLHRAVVAARKAKADVVVLDIHTNGGSLNATEQIRDDLLGIEVPVYSFINTKAWSAGALLAVTGDKIVMAPLASIGASQVIMGTGTTVPEVMEQKINSALKGQIRAVAKHKGHPVRTCEAFIDRNIDMPGVKPKGEVLTLDSDQATTGTRYVDPDTHQPVRLAPLAAFQAESLEALLQHEKIGPVDILNYEMTWSEHLARWLLLIRPLLLLLGLGALYVELKTPGLGVAGFVGVFFLALFFWGSYVADLATYIEILLFLLGIIFIILEIFVLPGFGLAGILGIVLVTFSLILAMVRLMPNPNIPELGYNYGMLREALKNFLLVFAGAIPLVWVLSRILPGFPIFRRIVLEPFNPSKAAPAPTPGLVLGKRPEPEDMIGKIGVAQTDLHPAGFALVEGRRLDVVTQGNYIAQGQQIRIVEIHKNVYMVEMVQQPDTCKVHREETGPAGEQPPIS